MGYVSGKQVHGVARGADRLVQPVLQEERRREHRAADGLATTAVAVRLDGRHGEMLSLSRLAEVAVDQGGFSLQIVVVQEANPRRFLGRPLADFQPLKLHAKVAAASLHPSWPRRREGRDVLPDAC
ncbi:hypothetical protein [Streptomyces sp. NBC_01485]|uniref:hypothetical protein n=1 Tax=Streptomyces sp. NBC_01485 TaxID=2903884 RepID=UPI003FCD3A5E